MGVIKREDIIGWKDVNGEMICLEHKEVEGAYENLTPLTNADFDDDEYVGCDWLYGDGRVCGNKIKDFK